MSVATYAAAQLLKVLPRVRLSRAVGRLCEQPLSAPVSRAVTGLYARAYRVELGEAAEGAGPYPSFDAFFTRALREGLRPLSGAPLVCPADGRIDSLGPVDRASRLFVKGAPYEVGELIGSDADAARYAGGSFAVVYLSPRDYHRVHSPAEGVIGEVRGIPGDLFPVNAIGERHVPRLFARNNRVSIVIDTERQGRVTVVMVGATIVGRISVAAVPGPAVPPGVHRPARPVARGEELGRFHLGSTAVVLLEPGLRLTATPGAVLYGQSLAEAAP